MDPYNFDPSNVTAWSQAQHAVLEQHQGGDAGQEGFEQHLAEARPPDRGPVSGGGRNHNPHPHLSAEDRGIIDKAIAKYAAQKKPNQKTVKRYTQALRRLGNHLGAHRQTIVLGDHESLVRHVKTYFPKDEDMKKGLSVLRAYRDPSYVASASGGRPRTIPSADDAPLSERLNASGMTAGSAARHDRSLRRFSNALNLAGYSISGLDHAARIEFAQKLFPKDELLLFALNKVGDAEHVSGAGASREPSGHAVPSPTLHLYPDDARIIDGLEEAELSMLKPEETSRRKVVQDLAGNQRRFGAWLQRKGRGSIVSRLTGTSEQQKSLNDDHTDFKKASQNADMGFDRLRSYLWLVEANAALGVSPDQAGGEPRRGESNSTWSPHLPYDFQWPTPEAVPDGSSAIYRGLDSFVDLPYTSQEVRDDAQSAPVGRAAARPPLFTGPSDAPAQSPDIFRGLQSFIDLPYTPQQMLDDAQSAPVSGAAAKPPVFTGPSDAPAQSSDIYRGLNSFVDLPYTPQQMRDDAQSAPVGGATARPAVFTEPSEVPAQSSDIYRGLYSFIDLPYTPQQMRDDAQSAPVAGAAGRPPLFTEPSDATARSSDIYRGLQSFVDLPSTPQQMRDDAQTAPLLSPPGKPAFFGGRSGVVQELEDIRYRVDEDWQDGSQPVPDFLLDVLDNIGVQPTQFSGPTQVSINGETYSITLGPRERRGAQFHHPRPSPVPGGVGPSATVASSGHRSGPVLDPTQWLGDEHIQRDYELLAQELQQNNPDLAARTRFVDPLIAQMLRSPSKEVAERALGWVRHDTAGFLFLPVSDASDTDRHRRGSHWSLLLVDRRDRGRPVAYHYDSTQGYNDRPAAELAGRLDANLQQAPIRQQQNGYDCGVFVVDGTRELVRRLAARPPDLNLNNLVISRQALRDRLGANVGFN
ncbi:Ulp1 family isopeptidase [Bradyrhizobium sp. Arg816]|uniref:Ulp1 family isopeptidase n=1 Tax=Bradyrhizobium sp. Arg816 TaxID=2998491 RepID=UPI00249E3553|nr:Ulp1 family isopeptidase [Bradyrhizobium sp. Arg816]MDI3567401.1 Ulp1 family isopeptidase [Bradyrhizobium sp. Arg816]